MGYLEKTMKIYRRFILFWTAFIGFGAVMGAFMFFLDPQNGFVMQGVLEAMQSKLPFADTLFSSLVFPGIALLIVNGVTNLTAFGLILKNKKAGYIMGFIFGITLMLWICVQFYVFAPELPAADVLFFIFGIAQAVCGYLAFVNYSQLKFSFKESDYKSIDMQNEREAVVYFSRMGYCRKLAYEKANERRCALIELKTTEKTDGILGFWWCGRFGMHRWEMELLPYADVSQYEKLFIISPVWVFAICAPVRRFLRDNKDKIRAAELTIVHFMRSRLDGAFKEARNILGERLKGTASVSSHFGNTKTV